MQTYGCFQFLYIIQKNAGPLESVKDISFQNHQILLQV